MRKSSKASKFEFDAEVRYNWGFWAARACIEKGVAAPCHAKCVNGTHYDPQYSEGYRDGLDPSTKHRSIRDWL